MRQWTQRLGSSGRALFKAKIKSIGDGGDGSARSLLGALALPNLNAKASSSWSAVQEIYLSTKETFEKNRVVFTVGTSIASVLTAWGGYSLRQYHQSKVEQRLQSIEQAMKSNYDVEKEEIKKIVSSGNVSIAACIATAWTSALIGYILGWRGGAWFANRKFFRQQRKLTEQISPQKLHFLRKMVAQFQHLGNRRTTRKAVDLHPAANATPVASQQASKSC